MVDDGRWLMDGWVGGGGGGGGGAGGLENVKVVVVVWLGVVVVLVVVVGRPQRQTTLAKLRKRVGCRQTGVKRGELPTTYYVKVDEGTQLGDATRCGCRWAGWGWKWARLGGGRRVVVVEKTRQTIRWLRWMQEKNSQDEDGRKRWRPVLAM
ncbi:hypothetical protein F4780DRAFT_206401 [Xylariomycetidae sp. FL0641]|nr:hypothetical protein F4780DRAFT_206401 [Xylariomycetidae sp. FL0641]